MKKVLCVILSLIMILSLTACNEEEKEPTTVNQVGNIADFEVSAYMFDEWTIPGVDGSNSYYKVILVYTDGFYSSIEESDIKFRTNDGNKPLTEAIDNVDVNVLNINTINKFGTCAYITINSNSLIDMKKVSVLVEGPTNYDSEASTKQEYVEKYGNTDGWNAVLTSIGSKTPPYQDIEIAYKYDNGGVIRLFDTGRSCYWYSVANTAVVNEESIEVELSVTPLKNTTQETFLTGFINGCYAAKMDENGEYVEVKLDERITISGEIEDGNVYVGISTCDGSDILQYNGELPDALVYNNNYLLHVIPLKIS